MSAIRFYTEEQLGPKRAFTPEGFLVCYDVPIARTGTLFYAPGEVPIEPGPDGIIAIERRPEDVFSEDAMRSFEGKPATNDHPPVGVKVTPMNWRQLSVGDATNVRRGDGGLLSDDCLYADILVKDHAAIQDVLAGKIQVSAGYDAEYEQIAPGRGRQRAIIGNHVAIVERGRCGPTCSVGDADTMPTTKRGSYQDRIRAAFKTRDEAALNEELDKVKDMMGDVVSGEDSGSSDAATHHVTVNLNGMGGPTPAAPTKPTIVKDDEMDVDPAAGVGDPNGGTTATETVPPWAQALMERMNTIEQAVILIAKDGGDTDADDDGTPDNSDDDDGVDTDGDGSDDDTPGKVTDAAMIPAKKTTGDRRASVGDSTSLAVPFQDMLARAAILCPDIKLPTFDAAQGARLTTDAMCDFRRRTLAKAWAVEDAQTAIKTLYTAKKPNFTKDALSCAEVTAIFNGSAELLKSKNTQDGQRAALATMDHGREMRRESHKVPSPAEINAKNRAKFGYVNR